MTLAGDIRMGFVPHGTPRGAERPAARLAAALRARYAGGHAVKRLAADCDLSAKRAENLLLGHWPDDVTFGRIVHRFGRDILEALFAPEIDETSARLAAEIRALEADLELKKSTLRGLGGLQARLSDVGAGETAPQRRAA